jgi:hypothetical protein
MVGAPHIASLEFKLGHGTDLRHSQSFSFPIALVLYRPNPSGRMVTAVV